MEICVKTISKYPPSPRAASAKFSNVGCEPGLGGPGRFPFGILNLFFHTIRGVMPIARYGSIAIGRDIGEGKKDAEGIQAMKDLGQNMAC
jgi:hypothetical protein